MRLSSVLIISLGCAGIGVSTSAHAQHMNEADAPCRGIVQTYQLSKCLSDASKEDSENLKEIYRDIQSVLSISEKVSSKYRKITGINIPKTNVMLRVCFMMVEQVVFQLYLHVTMQC